MAYDVQLIAVSPRDGNKSYVILQNLCVTYVYNFNQTNNDPQNILWTIEAIFTRQDILNQSNSHVWSHKNPRTINEQHFQHSFQCNVWLEIMGNILFGPYFLLAHLNANGFLAFLNNMVFNKMVL